MKSNKTTIISITLLSTLIALSCGKKDSNSESSSDEGELGTIGAAGTAGVQESEGETEEVAMAGQLNLSGLSLTEEKSYGILAFEMVGPNSSGSPKAIEIDENGAFEHKVGKTISEIAMLNRIRTEKPAALTDAEAIKISTLFQVSKEQVHDAYKNEKEKVFEYFSQFIAQFENYGGKSTMLVAYEKSGNKVKEAGTFKFIGLNAGDQNLSLIPNAALRGNSSFGQIQIGKTDDAKAELNASDALKMDNKQITSLAKADDILKSIKNDYMNDGWKASPFFMWTLNIDKLTSLETTAGDPNKVTFNGTGLYIGTKKASTMKFSEICHATEASRKIVELVLPKAIQVSNGNETTTVTSINNKGSVTEKTQDNLPTCNGGNGFYARDDGNGSFMLNFGTGGGMQGALPAGNWILKHDSKEIGWFDLATASPLDANGKSRVFMPSMKLIKKDGKYTGAEVEVYSFDGKSYTKMTDLSIVKKITNNWGGSVGVWSMEKEEEFRGSGKFHASEAKVIITFEKPVEFTVTGQFKASVSYQIGDANYRIEYRENQQ